MEIPYTIIFTIMLLLILVLMKNKLYIPKIVFQTWHSAELPPKMGECVARLRRENPEFEYRLFSDTDCRHFVVTHFDHAVVSAYDALIPGTFKADIWRYCALYVHGGVYLDIKYQCENGFRIKDLYSMFERNAWVKEADPALIYTGLMMTPPRNPRLLRAIHQIVENVRVRFYGRTETSPTGPDLVGRYFNWWDRGGMHYMYYDEYYPDSETKKRGFIKDLHTGWVILSHYPEYRIEQRDTQKTEYWMESWRNRRIYAVKTDD